MRAKPISPWLGGALGLALLAPVERHLHQRLGFRGIALAGQCEVHREGVEALQHPPDMPGPGRTGRGKRAVCRTRAATEHCGNA